MKKTTTDPRLWKVAMYVDQKLLKSQFPHISGYQPTVLAKAQQREPMRLRGVQIINQ